ncbi:MAG TPA: 16S rRNA (cytidine(1402)-2'-O)-methyltransferase [Alphaproteobacteria bacterium]|nr:16S rRNA (cytidine(1402)-2'-O)-methyltransferase [Alphaproteobacteria bacterium]
MATPIGNLGDITLRALEVLRHSDLIACEDTRVTGKLLAAYGIDVPMTPYHDHNAAMARPQLLARLKEGACIALVSDAGMPLISDPGFKLVGAAIDAGIHVSVVPGASAPLAALTLSGQPVDRFLFVGFLPSKSGPRQKALADLAALPATLVFFESGPRLAESLADMTAMLAPRMAAVVRELTKLHEEVRRGGLAELAAHYRNVGPPKGEIVVVVGPPLETSAPDEQALDTLIENALASMSLRDAAEAVARGTGLPKKRVYARALALAKPRGEK